MRWLWVCWFSVLMAMPALAEPPTQIVPGGFEFFSGILNYHNIAPLSISEAEEADGGGCMIIILGRLPREDRGNLGRLCRRVLSQGGAVLIGTDQFIRLNSFFPDSTSLAVTGETVLCTNNDNNWAFNPYCPFVVPRVNLARLGIQPDETSLLFFGLESLAVNLSSRLTTPSDGSVTWQRLADLPPDTAYISNRAKVPASERAFAYAAVGETGKPFSGRAMVLADAGLLSNQMLAPAVNMPDNDNLTFANRLTLWLQTSSLGPRSRALLLVNGEVVQKFDRVTLAETPPLPPVPLPDPLDPAVQQKVAATLNEAIAKFEGNDGFNRILLGPEDAGRPRRLSRLLLIVGIVLALASGIYFMNQILRRAYQTNTLESTASKLKQTTRNSATKNRLGAKPSNRLAETTPMSLSTRPSKLHATKHIPAFLREWFQAVIASEGASVGLAGQLPKVEILAGGREDILTKQMEQLWQTAQRNESISLSRWKALQPMLQEVVRRHRAGEWRFKQGQA